MFAHARHPSPSIVGVAQVSPMAMVQELKQLLMDYEETCHRTCFSLQLDGTTLDNFTHMKSISGMRDGCVLKPIDGESLSAQLTGVVVMLIG